MYSSQLSNFQILVVVMPSDNHEPDLAKSLSDLKEELRSGFSSLKRELVEENNLAIKKLKSTASSTPKFKKKGNEKQFEANSQDLDHVILTMITFSRLLGSLRLLRLRLKKPSTSQEKRSRIRTLGAGPYHLLTCVGDPASRVERLPFTFEVSAPS